MKIGKVKKGNYEYFRIQVTDTFGKRKELLAKTRKEVKQKYEQYLKNDIANLNLSNMSVEEFFHFYLFEILLPSSSIKDKTFTGYGAIYRNHIKNSIISKIKISELRKEHLQKYFNAKQQENYKVSTLKILKAFISTVLNYAETEDIITKNYTKGIKLKKELNKPNIKLLTDEEITKLFIALKSDKQLYIIVKIALATGMRISEILALTESDFDFKDNSINISKTLSHCREYNGEKFITVIKVTPPKTKNSIRVSYLPNTIVRDLKLYFKSVKLDYLQNKIKYDKGKPMFYNSKFSFIKLNLLTYRFNKIYKSCSINATGFHILRHTHISKLYQSGVNQKIIQEQVGHSNINMTMHYTHIENNQQKEAIQKLNDYF